MPITYFLHTIGNKKASNEQARLLEQFYFWVGLTERYSSATESKLAEDFQRMDRIAKGRTPQYPKMELMVDSGLIAEKSFDTNGQVILDNTNLKIATSRNYHHFFPKAYLEGADPSKEPNLIANITLIDGYSNKHRIGKKGAPQLHRQVREVEQDTEQDTAHSSHR